jgi:hypothetical protein
LFLQSFFWILKDRAGNLPVREPKLGVKGNLYDPWEKIPAGKYQRNRVPE